jgi:hypothetical protein
MAPKNPSPPTSENSMLPASSVNNPRKVLVSKTRSFSIQVRNLAVKPHTGAGRTVCPSCSTRIRRRTHLKRAAARPDTDDGQEMSGEGRERPNSRRVKEAARALRRNSPGGRKPAHFLRRFGPVVSTPVSYVFCALLRPLSAPKIRTFSARSSRK